MYHERPLVLGKLLCKGHVGAERLYTRRMVKVEPVDSCNVRIGFDCLDHLCSSLLSASGESSRPTEEVNDSHLF